MTLREQMLKLCDEAKLVPTNNFDKIVAAKERFCIGLSCPCDRENDKRFCISEQCLKDIEEKGHCHCNCYMKRNI